MSLDCETQTITCFADKTPEVNDYAVLVTAFAGFEKFERHFRLSILPDPHVAESNR